MPRLPMLSVYDFADGWGRDVADVLWILGEVIFDIRTKPCGFCGHTFSLGEFFWSSPEDTRCVCEDCVIVSTQSRKARVLDE